MHICHLHLNPLATQNIATLVESGKMHFMIHQNFQQKLFAKFLGKQMSTQTPHFGKRDKIFRIRTFCTNESKKP